MAKPAALQGLPDPFAEPERAKLALAPPQTSAEVQAAVEGVSADDEIEFKGETYRLAETIGAMPLFRFAYHARKGATAEDMEGLAAIYDMLADCLDPADWERFQNDTTTKKASAEELVEFVSKAIERVAARPTQRPSDSSAGPSTTSESSTGSSPSPDTPNGQGTEKLYRIDDLLEQAGG